VGVGGWNLIYDNTDSLGFGFPWLRYLDTVFEGAYDFPGKTYLLKCWLAFEPLD